MHGLGVQRETEGGRSRRILSSRTASSLGFATAVTDGASKKKGLREGNVFEAGNNWVCTDFLLWAMAHIKLNIEVEPVKVYKS